jgi:short-subunit dehydrogenase involved in D-alanine esterification of teichoic acids
MGLEAAKQFSLAGNKVIMVARNGERLKAEAAKLHGASAFACDITE